MGCLIIWVLANQLGVRMYIRIVLVILLAILVLFILVGCESEQERLERERAEQQAWEDFKDSCKDFGDKLKTALITLTITILGIGLLVAVVVAILSHIRDVNRREIEQQQERAEQRRRAHAKHRADVKWAPVRYQSAAKQLVSFILDCANILICEGGKGKAYAPGSPCHRSRKKMLDAIQLAQKQAQLQFNEDVTYPVYAALDVLARLESCCQNCEGVNKGKRKTRCLALFHAEEVEVISIKVVS